MKSTLLFITACALLTACGNSGPMVKPGAKVPQKPGAKSEVNSQEIISKKYSLKSDLVFTGSDYEMYKTGEGTRWEVTMVKYSFSYQSKVRITQAAAQTAENYCSVFLEAQQGTQAQDAKFLSTQKLLTGTLSSSRHNSRFDFSLQLQGAVFQSFFIYCRGVTGVAGIEQHLGHLLQIQ